MLLSFDDKYLHMAKILKESDLGSRLRLFYQGHRSGTCLITRLMSNVVE
jgi:hypothetical protein